MACTAVLFDGRWWVLFTGLFGRGLNVLGSGFLFFLGLAKLSTSY